MSDQPLQSADDVRSDKRPHVARDRCLFGCCEEVERLRALIKVLCSDPSPCGSEAFQRTRDIVNPEHRALLLAVLNDGSRDG